MTAGHPALLLYLLVQRLNASRPRNLLTYIILYSHTTMPTTQLHILTETISISTYLRAINHIATVDLAKQSA